MTCIISIFSIIGFVTTCDVIYMLAVDQWGIYQINQEIKRKKLEKENEYANKNK